MKKYIVLITTAVLLYSCNFSGKNEPVADGSDTANIDRSEIHDSLKATIDTTSIKPVNKDSVLMGLTKDIFTIFKSQDYSKLDTFIHPTEGVRFSPYATIESSDKKFTKETFQSLLNNKGKKIKWGIYDGSGDPILLAPNEYFKKFVYDANFLHPEKAGVNHIYKTGNSTNNLKSFYSGSDFTESHFSGGKSEMDWKSVRLVFKESNGKYYLVGVVHDQWTI